MAAPSAVSHLLEHEEAVYATALPQRRRRSVDVPADLPLDVIACLRDAGIETLHAFQGEAIEHIRGGRSTILAGGTGSGKSLCYQVPVLEALHQSKHATALYIAPTKSLAQDQARRVRSLGAAWVRPALYDGDTPRAQRAIVRRTANLVLTNPDMMSAGILPGHAEWARVLHGLQVVVVDESHVYRGVFGSHVAHVLRRLRRLARIHGAEPVFVLSSGTIANPEEHAALLTGLDAITMVDDHGAPRSARDIVLWNPPLDPETEERGSALGAAAQIAADLLLDDRSIIVFARTRRGCELIHRFTADRLIQLGRDELVERIAPYRAGYTPQERRDTERALATGELRGVIATNALELGIDIGALDASVCVTFPGSISSLWQQWGRAGRGTRRALAVLIAGEDALDQYFMQRPEELLGKPVEQAVISLSNPRIAVPQLAAAAAEAPLDDLDRMAWGAEGYDAAIAELLQQRRLQRTGAGELAYAARDRPASGLSLRSLMDGVVTIVDSGSGQLLGTVEVMRAPMTVHPGAVYLHRGTTYHVTSLDPGRLIAVVERSSVDWYTLPKSDMDIGVVDTHTVRQAARVVAHIGDVEVEEQLVGYQRTHVGTHSVIDVVEQTLPPVRFVTEAVWFAPPADVIAALGPARLLGSLHAAEHAMIAMLPLRASCDRADIGGLSIDWHPELEGPMIFIYDGHAGGVGIAQAGFVGFEPWVSATAQMIVGCPCEAGCPSCIQSPKCGNLNEPLDKDGALMVLQSILGAGTWA